MNNPVARKAKVIGKLKKAPATAPGQTLGYSLQFTRLTAMLLDAQDGDWCSLEVFDDVAKESETSATTVSQSKSALTDNPVADRAISLWKTLFNWLELVKLGIVEPGHTKFELYVSRPVKGAFIDSFHESQTYDEAKAAIEKVRNQLWGAAPEFAGRADLSDSLKRYVNPVLEADDKLVLPIIVNLQLKCGSGSPQLDIEAAIRRHPVSDAKVFDIADKLCGWVKREADKRLEKGLPAVISRDAFHREYTSYVRRVDRDLILIGFANKPSEAEKLKQLPSTFVRQLDLIERTFDQQLEAISDFLQASWDRTIWSKAGDIHEDSFAELNDNLERTWDHLNLATSIEAESKPEIQRGQLLYSKCMMHEARIQGMEPPPHFVPGCFHGLADDLRIGWHPAYRALLKKPGGQSS